MSTTSVSNLVINRVVSANRLLDSPLGVTVHRENRERWAVVLKLKGKTIYNVSNRTIVSDDLHVMILPKGSNYTWKCVEPGECIIIEFEANDIPAQLESFEIKDNNVIVNAFSKIEKSLDMKNLNHRLECNCYLYEILSFLVKSVYKEQIHPQKYRMLSPAMKYIERNYFDSTITNAYLSELCDMSTIYFRKIFESVYGVSPIKYLHNLRVNKAKAILLSDYETIEQVALSVGYNSIYHFSKMFKKYTGVSPSEYAKTSRK